MSIRLIGTGLAVMAAAAALLPSTGAVAAPLPSLDSTGVKSISLFTHRDSTSGWVTFRVKDRRGVAANVSQCDVDTRGRRINCDAYPLRSTKYRGGAWKIRPTSDGWAIRIFVGYYEVDPDECWDWRSGDRLGIQLAILNRGEKFLDRHTHFVRVQCAGVAARLTGPATMVARQGMNSKGFTVKASVVDRRHVVRSVRRCFYDVQTREVTNCYTDPVNKVAKRTSTGWAMTRDLTYNNPSRPECRELARERPRKQYRVSFRDGRGNALGSSVFAYRLTCRS